MKRTAIACSASTDVGVPAEVLFRLLHDEERFFELRPGAVEHQDIEPLTGGGHACTQVYEVGDRRMALRCRTTVFEPPLRFVDEIEAPDHRATVTTTLEAVGSATRLRIEQEVVLTGAVGAIRHRLMQGDAERRLVAALDRIRSVAEATPPYLPLGHDRARASAGCRAAVELLGLTGSNPLRG